MATSPAAEFDVCQGNGAHHAVGTNALHRQVAHLRIPQSMEFPRVLDDATGTDRYLAGAFALVGVLSPTRR
jgi:hypothetical protein